MRTETVRLIAIAKVGHYSSAFSCAEIRRPCSTTTSCGCGAARPKWAGPTCFVMGKGHAAVGPHPLLGRLGASAQGAARPAIRGSAIRWAIIPTCARCRDADFSSGSIGHALSGWPGMALGAPHARRRISDVSCSLGDGEMQEGQVWAAPWSRRTHRARNLTAIVDRNRYQLDGAIEDVMAIEPAGREVAALGWECTRSTAMMSRRSRPAAPRQGGSRAMQAGLRHRPHAQGQRASTFMERSRGWHLGLPGARRRSARAWREIKASGASR